VLCGMEGCGRKLSRPIWGTIWNRTDDRGWCHDLIWVALLIVTDEEKCCHVQIWSAILNESMWKEAFTTNLKYYVN
jgi:hypothetical protein